MVVRFSFTSIDSFFFASYFPVVRGFLGADWVRHGKSYSSWLGPCTMRYTYVAVLEISVIKLVSRIEEGSLTRYPGMRLYSATPFRGHFLRNGS